MGVLGSRRIAISCVTGTVVKFQPIVTLHVGIVIEEHSDPLRGPAVRPVVRKLDDRDHMIRDMEALAKLKLSATEGVNMAS